MTNRWWHLALGAMLAALATAAVTAHASAPPEVEQAVRNDLPQWIGPLSTDPHFGIGELQDPSRLTVGEGLLVHHVARTAWERGTATALDDFAEPAGAYVFPIRLDGKPVAVARVEQHGGRWTIVGIGASRDFEANLDQARATLARAGMTADIRYVSDEALGVRGLAGSDGRRAVFVPTGELVHHELPPGQMIDVAQLSARIHAFVAAAQAQAGQTGAMVLPADESVRRVASITGGRR